MLKEEEKDDDEFKAKKKDSEDSFDDDFDQSEDLEHGDDEFDMEAYLKFREGDMDENEKKAGNKISNAFDELSEE